MKFKIETILSITHKFIANNILECYDLLNYLLDDDLSSQQTIRAIRFVRSFIFAQQPQLNEWDIISNQINSKNWKEYPAKAKLLFGKELEINPIPEGVWTYKEPIEELQETMPDKQIISVKI